MNVYVSTKFEINPLRGLPEMHGNNISAAEEQMDIRLGRTDMPISKTPPHSVAGECSGTQIFQSLVWHELNSLRPSDTYMRR